MTKSIMIKGFPDYYATDSGNIYSRNYRGTGRIKKLRYTTKSHCGYPCVGISNNKTIKSVYVHRIIAETFIPNPKNKPQINHKNGVKTDNRVENLEWVSAQENTLHSINVLGNGKRRVMCVETGIVYETVKSAAAAVNGCSSGISIATRNKYRTYKGYHWKK